MPRRKKTIIEDDSHLPMRKRIERRLEKLIGYEFTTHYEHLDKIYEVLGDICEWIESSIEQTQMGDMLYLQMTCNNKIYDVLLPLNYIVADIGEIDEIEDLSDVEE